MVNVVDMSKPCSARSTSKVNKISNKHTVVQASNVSPGTEKKKNKKKRKMKAIIQLSKNGEIHGIGSLNKKNKNMESLKRKKLKKNTKMGKKIENELGILDIQKEKIMNAMTYSEWTANIQNAENSPQIGQETFEWMITQIPLKKFLENYWEKKPLHLKREGKNLYDGLLSTSAIDLILNKHNIQFTKNIDVTSYTNGKRETHNLEGRAFASAIWDFYNNGCSIRMLNPQTFYRPVWLLLATLQEYFKSFCGANVYLTPPDSQGFAPHYDDIEAFILQLEGKKRWRVYAPRSPSETLPRESSRNFGPEDVLPEPLMDIVLEAGDLLYFPRGFIHQGEALDGVHSLHITISTYQKTSYVDLLEKLLPKALAAASESHVSFREGLPLHYSDGCGLVSSDRSSIIKELMTDKLKNLVQVMMDNAPIESAADEMATEFIHASLPPYLTEEDEICSTYGGAEHWNSENNCVDNRVSLEPDSRIKLIRKNCCRLVMNDDDKVIRLYYNVDNSREYKADEVKYMEVESEMSIGIEALINAYPNFLEVEELPLETLELKETLATGLWERGILITEDPLVSLED